MSGNIKLEISDKKVTFNPVVEVIMIEPRPSNVIVNGQSPLTRPQFNRATVPRPVTSVRISRATQPQSSVAKVTPTPPAMPRPPVMPRPSSAPRPQTARPTTDNGITMSHSSSAVVRVVPRQTRFGMHFVR